MIDHILEWAQLLVRWFHVIVGAAWIGTSFYFNWLNHSLRPPEKEDEEVGGELWAVHGGGFYQVRKFRVAPAQLPGTLHWFKWEAYFTWISGRPYWCLSITWDQRVCWSIARWQPFPTSPLLVLAWQPSFGMDLLRPALQIRS